MKTTRQVQRDAKRLYQACFVDGRLDEGRVRRVVDHVVRASRPGGLAALSRFQRLVRLNRAANSATVVSAAPLGPAERAGIEANVARVYGPGMSTTFADGPSLLGRRRTPLRSD